MPSTDHQPTTADRGQGRTAPGWARFTVATRAFVIASAVIVAALGVAVAGWDVPARVLVVWLAVWAVVLAVRYVRLARRRWRGLWLLLGLDVAVLVVLAVTTTLTRAGGLAVTGVIGLVVANAGVDLADRH